MESILDKYAGELENGDRIHITLSRIYGEMFGLKINQATYGMFGKLCKVYSYKTILLALLDMYDMDKVDHTNVYPLIVWFIKKRMDSKIQPAATVNLNAAAKKMREEYKNIE